MKGARGVHVRDGRVADVEPVACDVVRFDLVELDISAVADLADLRARLTFAARECVAAADGRSVVLGARLVGQGELHLDIRRPGTLHDLLVALREDFPEDDPFCWWDAIDDRSRPAIDLEAARTGADFAADLIALADELGRRLATDERTTADLAAELADGLPGQLRQRQALERMLESSKVPAGRLVSRALVLALGELDGDGR
jgi:hypothetical protein